MIQTVSGTKASEVEQLMKIKVKRVNEYAVIPSRGSSHAAGYDLYAAIPAEVKLAPHTTVKVDTGLQFELPEGYFAGIFARSGIATREGLRPANCVGICDSDYRGNYIVAIHNDSDGERVITPGEKIAQMIVLPYLELEFDEVEELNETGRGAGGFGSTGK